MKRSNLLAGMALLAGMGFSAQAQAVSLVNGDFEQPDSGPQRTTISGANFLPGWTYDDQGTALDLYESSGQDLINAQSGTYYVSWGHLGENGGTLTQSFATSAGSQYTVSYWLTQQQGTDAAQMANASVFDGGTLLGSNTTAMTMDAGTWLEEQLTFTATSSTTTLVIGDVTPQSIGNANWALDNVSVDEIGGVSETPLPAALPLFASGLGMVCLIGRRRRRRA